MKNQVTGFNVGPADTSGSGDLPEVGDGCVPGNDGVITSVTPLGSSGGGLYVIWNGQEVLLLAAS
jgi:hypothetical protein